MKTIPLTRGYVTIVDDEDYEWLCQFKWSANKIRPKKTYAERRGILGDPEAPSRKGNVKMHREILGLSFGDGKLGDHVSGDTLDNRRCNLRVVTSAQNAMNRVLRADSITGVSGVGWRADRGKHIAYIKIKGKRRRHLGYFTTLEEAAAARREAEEELFGEYGYRTSQGLGEA